MKRFGREVVQVFLDFCLSLDPGFAEVLDEAHEVRIAIHLQGYGETVVIEHRQGKLFVVDDSGLGDSQYNIEIQGSPFDLLRQLIEHSNGSDTLLPGVRVKGELATLQLLQSIRRRYRPKLEAMLADRLGDSIAHRVGNDAETCFNWMRDSVVTVRDDVREYLLWEREVVVEVGAANEFYDAVDEVRDDCERLARRIELLERRLASSKKFFGQ